jgi:hypothetical protein
MADQTAVLAAKLNAGDYDGHDTTWQCDKTVVVTRDGFDHRNFNIFTNTVGDGGPDYQGKPDPTNRNRKHLLYLNAAHGQVANVRVTGSNVNLANLNSREGQSGIHFAGCLEVVGRHLWVFQTWGDNYTLSDGTGSGPNRRVRLYDITAHGAGRDALSAIRNELCVVRGMLIDGRCGRSNFDFEPPATAFVNSDVFIEDVTIDARAIVGAPTGLNMIAAGGRGLNRRITFRNWRAFGVPISTKLGPGPGSVLRHQDLSLIHFTADVALPGDLGTFYFQDVDGARVSDMGGVPVAPGKPLARFDTCTRAFVDGVAA